MTLVAFINYAFSSLAVISQIGIVLVVALLFLKKKNVVSDFLAKHALWISFIIALTATLGSLFYSEIAGYVPCELCWFQRIVMYPQVILLGLALLRKDQKTLEYVIWLSGIGVAIAGYHYLGQLGMVGLTCSAVGYSVSCAKIFFMTFGYVTFPLIAFTGFLNLVILAILHKKYK